jgi:hypothetical protein
MAGIRILTDSSPEVAMKAASRAAKHLEFKVYRVDDWELVAQRGNLALSIFVGAFVAYCYFHVRVFSDRGDRVEVEIERNSPWWTGVIGVNRVKNWAKSLADAIEDEIEDAGAKLYGRKDF